MPRQGKMLIPKTWDLGPWDLGPWDLRPGTLGPRTWDPGTREYRLFAYLL